MFSVSTGRENHSIDGCQPLGLGQEDGTKEKHLTRANKEIETDTPGIGGSNPRSARTENPDGHQVRLHR